MKTNNIIKELLKVVAIVAALSSMSCTTRYLTVLRPTLFVTLYSCETEDSCEWDDPTENECLYDTLTAKERTLILREYSVKSDALRSFIIEKVLPEVETLPKDDKFFIIGLSFYDVNDVVIEMKNFYGDPSTLPNVCGWFTLGGQQFVVQKTAKKYFSEKFKWHRFKYYYGEDFYIIGTDEMGEIPGVRWIFKINGNEDKSIYSNGL